MNAVDAELTQSLSDLARRINQLGLAAPALAFLEMNRPLVGLAHSVALITQPLLSAVFGVKFCEVLAQVFSSERHLDLLIALIEAGINSKERHGRC